MLVYRRMHTQYVPGMGPPAEIGGAPTPLNHLSAAGADSGPDAAAAAGADESELAVAPAAGAPPSPGYEPKIAAMPVCSCSQAKPFLFVHGRNRVVVCSCAVRRS